MSARFVKSPPGGSEAIWFDSVMTWASLVREDR